MNLTTFFLSWFCIVGSFCWIVFKVVDNEIILAVIFGVIIVSLMTENWHRGRGVT